MKMQFNSPFFLLVVLIMIFFKQSETAGQQKRFFQKINDLEFEMQKENVRRREEIRELRQSVDRMEEQFNTSLSILDKGASEFSGTETSRSQIENQQQDSGKIEEILGVFKNLKRGFSEEKKVTSRLRRHVTKIQYQLDHQRNVSIELSNGVVAILEALNVANQRNSRIEEALSTMSNVLNVMKTDIKYVKEIGIIMSSELNNTKVRNSQIEGTLKTDILEAVANTTNTMSDINDSLKVLEINGKQMNAILNETTMSSCSKDDIKELQNQFFCEIDHPKSCKEIINAGCKKSDEYGLSLETGSIKVYCDQQTDGGGWTVFQRRQDGSVNFFRDWLEYKEGFGSLTGEFWLGNEKIYKLLSTSKQYELRIDLGDFEGNTAYAKYRKFRIGPESDSYRLEASGFSGDAGDALEWHNGYTFKTKDRDGRDHCSRHSKGAWWYYSCHYSNLNGVYNSTTRTEGVNWYHWKGWKYSLRFVEMKFREIN